MKTVIDLAALMEERKISQRKMAEILDVSQSYISEIKNGRKPLSAKHEELLIFQFGKDICDSFRVASQDNRRIVIKSDVKGNGHDHQEANNSSASSDTIDKDLQTRYDECCAELTKTKIELEQANKRIDKLLSIIENLSKE